jgi:hypothetical protein
MKNVVNGFKKKEQFPLLHLIKNEPSQMPITMYVQEFKVL